MVKKIQTMVKIKPLMGVQQVLLSPDKDTKAILEYLCQQSGKLYNSGVYFARQTLFKTGKLLTGKFDLIYESTVSKTRLASSLPSVVAQQTLMSVSEAFRSFKELKNYFLKGELLFKPKPPSYLEGSKLFKVAFPNTGAGKPTLENNQIRFPLGLTVKRWFGISEFFLQMPINLDFSKVKEFTILCKNRAFYLELSYLVEQKIADFTFSEALSIDLGTADNLAACVDTLGNSFLIDSRKLKADNQLWNKRVSTKKEGKSSDYWDSWLDRVTRKRNHQMRDGINKSAKLIIDHCLKNQKGGIRCLSDRLTMIFCSAKESYFIIPWCIFFYTSTTQKVTLLTATKVFPLPSPRRSYGVHTSLLTLLHKLMIPPTPLKKGGKNLSKSPFLRGATAVLGSPQVEQVAWI
ncbi:MAG: transposase [Nostoc sp.]|uniref:RNA-guided endonuclease InsQ/TnpB family protein n=1 Tax=Nostoc sp. TaxID=1180 RepID=UPI002FF86ADF